MRGDHSWWRFHCLGTYRCEQTVETSPGPGCSELKTSLVNETLKFQTLISQICQYFFMKKCEKLLQCKSFFSFFQKKISVCLVIKS